MSGGCPSGLPPYRWTYVLRVLRHIVDADVVDDVAGADQQEVAIHLQQLEMVAVRSVAVEAHHLVIACVQQQQHDGSVGCLADGDVIIDSADQ